MRLRMCQETRRPYRKAFNGSVLLYALHFGNYLPSPIMFHIWREGWAFLLWYVQSVLLPIAFIFSVQEKTSIKLLCGGATHVPESVVLWFVGAVGIELKATLKLRQVIDSTKREKRYKHAIRPTEVHAGYTST